MKLHAITSSQNRWIVLFILFAIVRLPLGSAFSQSGTRGKSTEKMQLTKSTGFALVELFTSEGCSSCPAADKNLIALAKEAAQKKLPVYTLSFHVDYWNDLGWDDPFSSEAITQRQRQYSRAFRSNRVYTPQMIVNGTKEFVGSHREKSLAAINSALRLKPKSRLELGAKIAEDEIQVSWKVHGIRAGDVINIALVQNNVQRHVVAGENKGRTLQHTNVVREFSTVKANRSEISVRFDIPEQFNSNEFHVVAFLQSANNSVIQAATRAVILKNKK